VNTALNGRSNLADAALWHSPEPPLERHRSEIRVIMFAPPDLAAVCYGT
jgi:hypothetical protein